MLNHLLPMGAPISDFVESGHRSAMESMAPALDQHRQFMQPNNIPTNPALAMDPYERMAGAEMRYESHRLRQGVDMLSSGVIPQTATELDSLNRAKLVLGIPERPEPLPAIKTPDYDERRFGIENYDLGYRELHGFELPKPIIPEPVVPVYQPTSIDVNEALTRMREDTVERYRSLLDRPKLTPRNEIQSAINQTIAGTLTPEPLSMAYLEPEPTFDAKSFLKRVEEESQVLSNFLAREPDLRQYQPPEPISRAYVEPKTIHSLEVPGLGKRYEFGRDRLHRCHYPEDHSPGTVYSQTTWMKDMLTGERTQTWRLDVTGDFNTVMSSVRYKSDELKLGL